jgi:small subunit ribosomal protein S14
MTRSHNRCLLTGRSKAYLRRFKVSRIMLRELALAGKIPGLKKASW